MRALIAPGRRPSAVLRARRAACWLLFTVAAAVAATGVLSACGGKPAPQAEPRNTAKPSNVQVGIASWYGEKHHGKKTASGQPFDMNALTCAHRTLPFGTRIKVTRVKNGRSVVVRVNDRGPYSKKRIIDLSRAAAQRLDMIDDGIAKVELEVLRK